MFRGANPPPGAVITVWVKAYTGDPLSIEIANPEGQPVAKLSAPGVPGTSWPQRFDETSEMVLVSQVGSTVTLINQGAVQSRES